MAGIAHRNAVAGNVLDHNASAADDHIASDGDPGHNLNPRADPYIVANRNGIRIFHPPVPALKINGVPGCMEAAVRPNEHIVPKGHLGSIQNHQVVIGVEIFAQLDIVAVIAPEGSRKGKILSGFPQRTSCWLALSEGRSWLY